MIRAVPRQLLDRELQRQREYAKAMHAAAEHAAAAVRAEAERFRRTGDFERSISAEGDRVVTTDAFPHLIEFGGANNPAYAPFRRGLRAAGFRLDESRV